MEQHSDPSIPVRWGDFAKLASDVVETSKSAQQFARENRDARAGLSIFSHRLLELGSVLDHWQHDGTTDHMLGVLANDISKHFERVLKQCHEVLQDARNLLGASQIRDWSVASRDIDSISKQLDAYTLCLNSILEVSATIADRTQRIIKSKTEELLSSMDDRSSTEASSVSIETRQPIESKLQRLSLNGSNSRHLEASVVRVVDGKSWALSRDGKLLVVYLSGSCICYDTNTGEEVVVVEEPSKLSRAQVDFAYGSQVLVFFDFRSEAVHFVKLNPRQVRSIKPPPGSLHTFADQSPQWAFSHSQCRLAVTTQTGRIRLYTNSNPANLEGWALARTIEHASIAGIRTLSFSKNNDGANVYFETSGKDVYVIRAWQQQASDPELVGRNGLYTRQVDGRLLSFSWNVVKRHLYICDDVESPSEQIAFTQPNDGFTYDVVISEQQRVVVPRAQSSQLTQKENLKLWELDSGREISMLGSTIGQLYGGMSADGKLLVSTKRADKKERNLWRASDTITLWRVSQITAI